MLGLVKDLGVDSAGARRRRVATSNARLQKAWAGVVSWAGLKSRFGRKGPRWLH